MPGDSRRNLEEQMQRKSQDQQNHGGHPGHGRLPPIRVRDEQRKHNAEAERAPPGAERHRDHLVGTTPADRMISETGPVTGGVPPTATGDPGQPEHHLTGNEHHAGGRKDST
ncbi:hypothetical protein FHR83_008872 [Actinoplanes campanulatus]|uniref:Uncharacterized protein n=1 Tax=Actinoplanes campanulatus TaxID=113559 RepID=A0A7W5ASE4_9ACTN|nr:hypothetical protein [Actinoplanes campanulatus]MBB3101144.1 hypothetical protein [Actinoplanes campanulatus]GGN51673.1 hypothetical protein GCM10010109_92000 [Actinoplanes campanulatus]GID42588.1 hypothetical protein Aca09nite_90940 [Actinoplanes campanulatus]